MRNNLNSWNVEVWIFGWSMMLTWNEKLKTWKCQQWQFEEERKTENGETKATLFVP